jgi:hypothetical protein
MTLLPMTFNPCPTASVTLYYYQPYARSSGPKLCFTRRTLPPGHMQEGYS